MRSSIGATATAKRAALVCQARTPPCPSRRLPCQSRSPSLCQVSAMQLRSSGRPWWRQSVPKSVQRRQHHQRHRRQHGSLCWRRGCSRTVVSSSARQMRPTSPPKWSRRRRASSCSGSQRQFPCWRPGLVSGFGQSRQARHGPRASFRRLSAWRSAPPCSSHALLSSCTRGQSGYQTSQVALIPSVTQTFGPSLTRPGRYRIPSSLSLQT